MIQRFIDWLFSMEEINGHRRCPTYMYRWCLFRIPWFAVYLHHFVGDDWSRDRHDHPKRFVSIGLKGRYVEETPIRERVYTAPWIRTFPATHVHRLRLINDEPCWTLVLVFRPVREWGFWSEQTWIHWKRYVGSANADRAKNC